MTNVEAVALLKLHEKQICLTECEQHRGNFAECDFCTTMEMMDKAISALEKQVPEKPIWHVLEKYKNGNVKKGAYKCPNCLRIEYVKRRDALDTHCGFCGQMIDWEGVEE